MLKKAMLGLVAMAIIATPVVAKPRPDMSTASDVTLSKEAGWTDAFTYDKAPWWMNSPVITQTGFVFAEIPANRANFSATFQTNADTVDKAQAKAIERTRALNEALGRLGKDAVRVTTSFSMRALYEEYRDKDGNKVEDRRADKINGYEVSLNLSLEVRDVAALEKAYALVLAASPSSTGNVDFSLQPSNEQNTWMYTQAVNDAHARAVASAEAAGGHLGAIKLIDPTGRACETDILARGAADVDDDTQADKVAAPVVQPRVMLAEAPPPPPPPGSADALEAQAMKNPFIQTPPLERLDAKACVVYSLN
jgi:uncharacterized protein YggE